MCGGSAPKDNSGQVAADQEAKRQANITAGTQAVNDAFSKSFTPGYYTGVTDNYTNYYNPQLDQQYQEALNKLTYQLGQQGILQSTEGDHQLGLLKQSYDTNKATVANNGANAAQTARANVNTQKNALLAQAQQAGDPSALAAQASEAAAAIPSPVSYSPLGSVFAGALGQGTNALSIQQGGSIAGGNNYNTGGSPSANPISGNSGASKGSGILVN
jgi:hypothetical protein